MQEMITGSGALSALAEAMATIENPRLDETAEVRRKDGGHAYTFRYASLGECMRVVRAALGPHGLFVMQDTATDDKNRVAVQTIIMSASGEVIRSSWLAFAAGNVITGAGGVVTYLKRYSLCALFGIVGSDDKDGDQLAEETMTESERATAARNAHNSALKARIANVVGQAQADRQCKGIWRKHKDDPDTLTAKLEELAETLEGGEG